VVYTPYKGDGIVGITINRASFKVIQYIGADIALLRANRVGDSETKSKLTEITDTNSIEYAAAKYLSAENAAALLDFAAFVKENKIAVRKVY